MTSGSANFQEASAVVGDTIHADFTWNNAVYYQPGGCYAAMYIIDPDGVVATYYNEPNLGTGNKTLTYVTDKVGTWTAAIDINDGADWVTATDMITVSSPGVTSGSANFQETSAVVGDTLHADFAWANAYKIGDIYVSMWIFDPDNMVKAYYYELTNSTDSKTLACVTDQSGTWRAKIEVWDGSNWLTYTDTVNVSSAVDITLGEGVTCGWIDGYNNHGPELTEFAADATVYAYIELHGSALYNVTVRHEWWYKAAGESSFTRRWSWTKTCTSHYTEWATWTWWDIGNSYGPGTGYIAVYADDDYIGKTNDYQMGELEAIFEIVPAQSTFNVGPCDLNTVIQVCNLCVVNNGTVSTSGVAKLYEYPGEANENLLAELPIQSLNPGQSIKDIIFSATTPSEPGQWPLGVKVFALGEPEPGWGTSGTSIFNVGVGEVVIPWSTILIIGGGAVVAVLATILLARR